MCTALALVLLGTALASAGRAPGSALADLKTRAERTAYTETSRYDDVMFFLRAVDIASPRVHLTSFGYSFEGRSLPLAVVGRIADARPETVLASNKTRVYIQADIHAGEVEGKEAMLELLRSLAAGEHARWLDTMVLLVAPIYNPDGNERINLTNRPGQHGPIGGMGQRANAQNYDLNRDHMKLDSPEARSLAALLTHYDPHVALDLHTTNGTRHAYHVTFEPPLHPNTAPEISALLRNDLFPAVTRAIKGRDGWDMYYYGNLPGRRSTAERGWYTSEHLPRFNNNYIGLRNRLGILCEAYAYLTVEERIRATRRFVEEVLDYVQSRGTAIRNATAAADAASLVGRELAVRAELERSPQPVEILMGDVAQERNPYTGEVMLRRLDVRKPEMMPAFITFRASETAQAPRAYVVSPALERVVDRLQAHGIRFTTLTAPAKIAVEQFRITRSIAAERAYQGHNERTLEGAWEGGERDFPAGTLIVPVGQPLGRLVFALLEPRSDDGLATWNMMDDALRGTDICPVFRVHGELPQAR